MFASSDRKSWFNETLTNLSRKAETVWLSMLLHVNYMGTAVALWLRCCATNRKVTGSIPAGVIGILL